MSKEDLSCSFCGRLKDQTNLLIAGLDAHICDRCINQASEILIEDISKEKKSEKEIDGLELKTPKEIKEESFLVGKQG